MSVAQAKQVAHLRVRWGRRGGEEERWSARHLVWQLLAWRPVRSCGVVRGGAQPESAGGDGGQTKPCTERIQREAASGPAGGPGRRRRPSKGSRACTPVQLRSHPHLYQPTLPQRPSRAPATPPEQQRDTRVPTAQPTLAAQLSAEQGTHRRRCEHAQRWRGAPAGSQRQRFGSKAASASPTRPRSRRCSCSPGATAWCCSPRCLHTGIRQPEQRRRRSPPPPGPVAPNRRLLPTHPLPLPALQVPGGVLPAGRPQGAGELQGQP